MCKDNLMGKSTKSSKEVDTHIMKGGANLTNSWTLIKGNNDSIKAFNDNVMELNNKINGDAYTPTDGSAVVVKNDNTLKAAILAYSEYAPDSGSVIAANQSAAVNAINDAYITITKDGLSAPTSPTAPPTPTNTSSQQDIYTYLKYVWDLYNTQFTEAKKVYAA